MALKKSAKTGGYRKPGARVLRLVLGLVLGVFIAGMVAITALRWVDPLTSSIILQGNFADREHPHWVSFDWRPLEQISKDMLVAVIAAEDQRFLQHRGVDFVELFNILRKRESRPRGASTITQQAAKNLFLWGGRSYLRKMLEAVLAFYIDFAWGKRRVLEIYLNIVQFGPRIYGVENASQHFFGKPAARLNRFEAARLAAVLPNPGQRSALHANHQVMRRQKWILGQIRALGGVGFIDNLE